MDSTLVLTRDEPLVHERQVRQISSVHDFSLLVIGIRRTTGPNINDVPATLANLFTLFSTSDTHRQSSGVPILLPFNTMQTNLMAQQQARVYTHLRKSSSPESPPLELTPSASRSFWFYSSIFDETILKKKGKPLMKAMAGRSTGKSWSLCSRYSGLLTSRDRTGRSAEELSESPPHACEGGARNGCGITRGGDEGRDGATWRS